MTMTVPPKVTFWHITTRDAEEKTLHLVRLWSDIVTPGSKWLHNENIALHVQHVVVEGTNDVTSRHDTLSTYRISDKRFLQTTKRAVPTKRIGYKVTRDHVFSTSDGTVDILSLITLQPQLSFYFSSCLGSGSGSFHRLYQSVSDDGSLWILPTRSRARLPINDGLIVFDAVARMVYKCHIPGAYAVAFQRQDGVEGHALKAYTISIPRCT